MREVLDGSFHAAIGILVGISILISNSIPIMQTNIGVCRATSLENLISHYVGKPTLWPISRPARKKRATTGFVD